MGDNSELAAKFEAVLKRSDFAGQAELLREFGSDDFVEEWPQSGERLTKAASLRMAEAYPAMSGTSPTFANRRMLGGDDVSSSRERSTTAMACPSATSASASSGTARSQS
jgi:hypothetical protein